MPTTCTQASSNTIILKAPAIPVPENSPTDNLSGSQTTRISDPKKFDGTSDDLPEFTVELRLKLHGNCSLFLTEYLRLTYSYSILAKNAFPKVQGLINMTTIAVVNIQALITVLEDAFRDSDRIRTVESKLSSLEQVASDFSGYLAEFTQLASKVKSGDTATLPAIRPRLSNMIQNPLIDKDKLIALANCVNLF